MLFATRKTTYLHNIFRWFAILIAIIEPTCFAYTTTCFLNKLIISHAILE